MTMEESQSGAQPSRRTALKKAGLGGLGLMIWMKNADVLAQDKRLVIRDTGGPTGEAFIESFYKPFREATGIEIVPATSQAFPTAFIKQMVEAKSNVWDMAHVSKDVYESLAEIKYLEPLNSDAAMADLPAAFKTPFYAAVNVVGQTFAYRTDAGTKSPQSWRDFWDVKAFPGRRALRRSPMETLEYALLADGVSPQALYPLDVERAFKAMDRIKKDIAVWWTTGAQTSQLLKAGEVQYCSVWNGRAQAVMDEGAPVAMSWAQFMYGSEGWVIPKGSPKADMCREFIRFTLDPKRQANVVKKVAYGPTLPKAYDFVDDKRGRMLPTHPANIKNGIEWNTTYWVKTRDPLTERFTAWVTA